MKNMNYSDIYILLSKNYVENEKYSLIYSKEFLENYQGEGVCLYLNNKLAGYVNYYKMEIKYLEKVNSILIINFLCVDKNYRNQKITNLLLCEARLLNTGYTNAIYTIAVSDKKISNTTNLICKAKYYYHQGKQEYKVPYQRIFVIYDKNLYDIFIKFTSKYKIAPKWSFNDFCVHFQNENIHSFSIYDLHGDLVGFYSYYITQSKNKQTGEFFDTTNVYYYMYRNTFTFTDLLYMILANHTNISILDIMDNNPEILTKAGFTPGTYLNYYSENPLEIISNNNLCLLFN